MTPENASGFINCVKHLADKAGIKSPLNIELVPSHIPNASFRCNGNIKTLSFSEGVCKLLGSENLHAHPSGEMQAVISHELCHVRHMLREAMPHIALIGGLPLAGMGAMVLIDKTNEKLRERKALNLADPPSFWQAFNETLHDTHEKGIYHTIHEFSLRSSPLTAKLFSSQSRHSPSVTAASLPQPDSTPRQARDIIGDMSWDEAIMEEAKYLAVGAAMLLPALAACRHLSMANEFRADRFAVALTGHKDIASALQKMAAETEAIVSKNAATPLEKNWAKRISQSVWDYVREALLGTHPADSRRITAIKATDIAEAAKHFGL